MLEVLHHINRAIIVVLKKTTLLDLLIVLLPSSWVKPRGRLPRDHKCFTATMDRSGGYKRQKQITTSISPSVTARHCKAL